MSEFKIFDNAILTNIENSEYRLNKIVNNTVSIAELLPKLHNNAIYYIDPKFNYSKEETPSTKYMWIDTGLISPGNKPIFISLIKNTNGIYEGDFVGVPKLIADSMLKFFQIMLVQFEIISRCFVAKS